MRRLIAPLMACVISLLGVAGLGSTVPAVAAVEPAFTYHGVSATTPGSVTQIDVMGGSANGIAKIEVTVNKWRSAEVVAMVDDFELVNGDEADGTWRSRTSVTVAEKNFSLNVRMVDGAGNEFRRGGFLFNAPQPEIVDWSISPTTTDIEHKVSFTGRLILRDADGSIRPLADQSVGLNSAGEWRTADDGSFSGTKLIGLTDDYRITTANVEDYRAAKTPPTRVEFVLLPTELTLEAQTANPPVVGENAVLSGRLRVRHANGEWTGLGGVSIDLSFRPADDGFETMERVVTTNSDGGYSVTVPITASGFWWPTVKVPYGYQRPDHPGVNIFGAVFRTRIEGFTATPNPVGKGAKLSLRGRVIREGATGTRAAVSGGTVHLEYSFDGGRTVEGHVVGTTDQQGYFNVITTAQADRHWGVFYNGASANSSARTGDLSATSSWIRVDVRYRTAVSSFNASPEPVSKGKPLTVTGVVKRSVDGSTWKAWSAQTVYVYFKAKGATSWSYAGTVKSDSYGKFRRSFTASKDGTWKAVYKGNADHLRADSATDYVDVR